MNSFEQNANPSAAVDAPSPRTPCKDHLHRVLLIDEHPIVRHGLRRVLEGEKDMTVCGEAESMRQAAAAIEALNPDVVIADISADPGEGMDLIRHLREHHHGLRILVLSTLDEAIYAERLLSAGANGYIMKEASNDQLLMALRRVLEGQTYLSAAIASHILHKVAARKTAISLDPIARLSVRELQVLQLIGTGKSTRETAQSLHLSIKTVESHRQRIKRKLNLDNGAQLVRYALLGLAGSAATAPYMGQVR